jgi:HAD superfamily hydrolase (TIGR01662 family)
MLPRYVGPSSRAPRRRDGPEVTVTIRAVFFDVGETLVDETGAWGSWADWLGVPRFTFFAVLGGLIERGEEPSRVLRVIRPGFDLARERAARVAAGVPEQGLGESIGVEDLYPDAVPCLRALREAGYRIGIAGNQPLGTERALERLGVPADVVASSALWRVRKPAPEFFARIVEAAGMRAEEIAYVGDRVDNDVAPAADAGMAAVFLKRGPWGHLQAERPEAARARLRLDSLAELPAALRSLEP